MIGKLRSPPWKEPDDDDERDPKCGQPCLVELAPREDIDELVGECRDERPDYE
jgi:hypothetical protein